MHIKKFTFNPFEENTYVVYEPQGNCFIFDPGCYDRSEQQVLKGFIKDNGLTPVRLINTHTHIDHILGNAFIHREFGLRPELHEAELEWLRAGEKVADMYGINYEGSPDPERFLDEGDVLNLGDAELEVLFTPGHSPAELSFYCHSENWLIAGDVLFRESIGRTDLPGGNYDVLMRSIREKILPLGDEVTVYSGHGPDTTIGHEKRNNPFITGRFQSPS